MKTNKTAAKALIALLSCAAGLAIGAEPGSEPGSQPSSEPGSEPGSVNPNPQWDDQWAALESDFLSGYAQLTPESVFVKAGESYFSPDGRMIVFQAIPNPQEGQEAGEHYSMYVATVTRDDDGDITGLGQPSLISNPGSANTCGWFNPKDPMKILFGSTRTRPQQTDVAGFQRDSSKYAWQFPVEMDILVGELKMAYALSAEAEARAKAMMDEDGSKTPEIGIDDIVSVPKLQNASPLWLHQGYDAEGSWSPDGRFILYTRLEPGSNDGDIWVFDTQERVQTKLVAQVGYDGGPFFSPDGKSICYRSDRRGDNLLQIFVATLAFDGSGKITGIGEEKQLTDNEHVNWCPFFTPDGKYLLYATSELGHANYEIFAIDASGDRPLDETPRMRITHARGFDGLPAFSADGEWMIWTAQRGAQRGSEDHPSSQIWAARIDLGAIDEAYRAQRKALVEKKEHAAFESYTPGG